MQSVEQIQELNFNTSNVTIQQDNTGGLVYGTEISIHLMLLFNNYGEPIDCFSITFQYI